MRQPVSQRDLVDAHLINELIDAHGDDPDFGYRFLTAELERGGHQVGKRRVGRLCRQQRICSTTVGKGRKGSGKTPGPAVHEDLVKRDLTADTPTKVWVTDIERHEAFLNRAVMKGHRHASVAADALKLRAA